MKKIISSCAILILTLISCNQKPSLEKYFVENSENKNFVQVDVAPSILNVDKTQLTSEQRLAMKSFDKMNFLAFKIKDNNKAQFESERLKVNEILKNEKYQQLMKFGSGKEGATVSYVGDDEHISEFVLYGNKKENGFAIVRILGKNMNPSSIMTMLTVLKSSKIDMDQLKPLQDLIK
jgi:hypothetical protein